MNEILRILFVGIISIFGLAALFASVEALFSRTVAVTRDLAEEMPGRSLLVGVINFLFLSAITMGFLAFGEWTGANFLAFPGILAMAILTAAISFGLAGVVRLVGDRLFPDRSSIALMVWSTVTLTLGSLLPLVGWFLLFPYISLLGLGAFIIGLFRRFRPTDDPEKEVNMEADQTEV